MLLTAKSISDLEIFLLQDLFLFLVVILFYSFLILKKILKGINFLIIKKFKHLSQIKGALNFFI